MVKKLQFLYMYFFLEMNHYFTVNVFPNLHYYSNIIKYIFKGFYLVKVSLNIGSLNLV